VLLADRSVLAVQVELGAHGLRPAAPDLGGLGLAVVHRSRPAGTVTFDGPTTTGARYDVDSWSFRHDAVLSSGRLLAEVISRSRRHATMPAAPRRTMD
jgi:hypothetical protein